MTKNSKVVRGKSKAALTIHVENKLNTLGNGLEEIRDEADSILVSNNPSKRQRRVLCDVANPLIALQKSTSDDIQDLVPVECSKYPITRIRSNENHKHMVVFPNPNSLHTRCFEVAGALIDLPENPYQYTAAEACVVVSEVEFEKEKFLGLSIRKILNTMVLLCFRASHFTDPKPLIPCKRFHVLVVLKKYRENPDMTGLGWVDRRFLVTLLLWIVLLSLKLMKGGWSPRLIWSIF